MISNMKPAEAWRDFEEYKRVEVNAREKKSSMNMTINGKVF